MKVPERTPEALKRLHSLTGMIPLGAFLIEHLAVNAFALAGPPAFRHATGTLDRIPFLTALELALIAAPLAVHSVLGVLIATMAKQVRTPGGLLFHTLGVTIVACHFGNGLSGFAARWGLARSPQAERAAGRFGL